MQHSMGQQLKHTWLQEALGRDPVAESRYEKSRHVEQGSGVRWKKAEALGPGRLGSPNCVTLEKLTS